MKTLSGCVSMSLHIVAAFFWQKVHHDPFQAYVSALMTARNKVKSRLPKNEHLYCKRLKQI